VTVTTRLNGTAQYTYYVFSYTHSYSESIMRLNKFPGPTRLFVQRDCFKP